MTLGRHPCGQPDCAAGTGAAGSMWPAQAWLALLRTLAPCPVKAPAAFLGRVPTREDANWLAGKGLSPGTSRVGLAARPAPTFGRPGVRARPASPSAARVPTDHRWAAHCRAAQAESGVKAAACKQMAAGGGAGKPCGPRARGKPVLAAWLADLGARPASAQASLHTTPSINARLAPVH